MDRITASLIKDFSDSNGFSGTVDESRVFEHFANYSVLFAELSDTFDLDDVAIGGDGNVGIDGAAIIVNGTHVTSEEDAYAIVEANKYLDADFVFIQAKTSSSFDLGEMGKFLFAVNDFFSDSPGLTHTQATRDLIAVKDAIYSRGAAMRNRNPSVAMFYVCTGKWLEDKNLRAQIDAGIKALEQTRLFHKVTFTPVDADRLHKLYRATRGKSSARFTFLHRVALPQQVAGVKEAHFGLVPATEFLKLINDDNENIKKSLFYDNVRDFQDFNDVNTDIRGTLQSSDRQLFPLLNNGVTIIAGDLRPTGIEFQIDDYQIVNGCQTSHVLHNSRSDLTDKVFVPVRVISTSDDSVVSKIIKATNFQTEVKPDQLYALSEFQKKLEEYYATFDGEQRLFYERRSKQYASASHVEKVRIVTIQQQIRAFVAMFLNEPHRGHYPRSLAQSVGKTLFGRDHIPDPYYICAFAHFRLEYFFRRGELDTKYKPARYHLLMGARQILHSRKLPRASSNDMKRFCATLRPLVHSDTRLLQAFHRATSIVDEACSNEGLDRKLTKTVPFSKRFEEALSREFPVGAKGRTAGH
jgi:hypothetical protein